MSNPDTPLCDAPHETGLCTAHQRMASNTSDDELREQLVEILHKDGASNPDYTVNTILLPLIRQREEQAAREARIDEREGMQFFDDDGQETHKPYIQYRYTGSGLKLDWDDRTKEIEQLTTTHKGDQ